MRKKRIHHIEEVNDLEEGQIAIAEAGARYRVYPMGETAKAKWVVQIFRKGDNLWAKAEDGVNHRITNEGGWVIQPVYEPEHMKGPAAYEAAIRERLKVKLDNLKSKGVEL